MPLKHKRSELLELLNKRWREWVAMDCPAFLPPVLSYKYLHAVQEAVTCYERLQDSDPFAAPRIRAHLLRGLEAPALVLADCKSQEARRRHETVHWDGLEKARAVAEERQRKIDEDKAWNQFRAKQFEEEKAA